MSADEPSVLAMMVIDGERRGGRFDWDEMQWIEQNDS